MGVKLPVPLAPFQELDIQGGSITIDVNAKQIVIPTDNQYLLPSFNQWTLNPNRCNLEETPCGGLKNSIVQDTFPGSLTIEGDGCYLQNLAGTYTGKSIGAGKLSETASIKDTGYTGIEFATADGIIFRPGNGAPFLLRPPNCIVEEFKVVNISDISTYCTISIQCPDVITSLELYNLDLNCQENLTFTKIANSYIFSRTIEKLSSIRFQITIKYQELTCTQTLDSSLNSVVSLQHMSKSWIAVIPTTGPEIDVFHFNTPPNSLSFKQEPNGTISQITLFPGNSTIYHSRITNSNHSKVSDDGYIPDCLNTDIEGSVAKFFKSFGLRTDFSSETTLQTWIVPAISDTKILPLSEITDDLLGDEIELRMCPGEYGCASFVLSANIDTKLSIVASNLVSGENSISKDKIVIRYVKCWYQNGFDNYGLDRSGIYYTPELLLKDDSLINVNVEWDKWNTSNLVGANYLKLRSGNYINISSNYHNVQNIIMPSIDSMDVIDSENLQPLILKSNYNKQVWITLQIPTGTIPGIYYSTVSLIADNNILKTVTLKVIVLPFSLLSPSLSYHIFYNGRISAAGSISCEFKTSEQMTAELKNMVEHGVTNPTIAKQDYSSALEQILLIRQACGVDNTSLYYLGINLSDTSQTITSKISSISNTLTEYGVQKLYIYGIDEQNLNTVDIRAKIDAAHAAGAKIFCCESVQSHVTEIADVLDLCVVGLTPSTSYPNLYHNYNSFDGEPHKIYMYGQPQTIPEYPRFFRWRYGLLLWQLGYDGAMDYAYQHSAGNIWNDFDHVKYRDHVFAYPTSNGVIDTVQWEGFREAVNDIRYLTTLQEAIMDAKTRGVSTTDIETWLETLKTTDLSTVDLDDVRGQMIDYILLLQ